MTWPCKTSQSASLSTAPGWWARMAARMRSLETGRPMLRATNTGMTAAIDANGRVIGRLTPYTIGSLDVTVQGTSGSTPYVTSGNNTVLAISLLLLAFGFAFGPAITRRQNGKQ